VLVRRRGGRDEGSLFGKLSLIDLAGSERAGDTMSNNRQVRVCVCACVRVCVCVCLLCCVCMSV
jgi:hypothetical protein